MLLTANVFGRHSDTRLIEALSSQPQDVFDYRDHQGEFWLDYVADVGDGWNSTYAVASAIAAQSMLDTRAGQVLVMGGDEVYPYPSRNAYARRTETPYREAFAPRTRPARHLRHSRQPRLVRQPRGVLARVLSTGARVRRLPHAPDPQLFRARAAAQLVAAGRGSAIGRGFRRAAAEILPRRGCPHGREGQHRAVRARAAVGLRGHLSGLRGLHHAHARLLLQGRAAATGRRDAHGRPAFLSSLQRRQGQPQDHRGRGWRVPASHAPAPQPPICRRASPSRAATRQRRRPRNSPGRTCSSPSSIPRPACCRRWSTRCRRGWLHRA